MIDYIVDEDFRKLGKIFGVTISLKWEESYELFNELESAGRRDFVRGGTKTSGQVYIDMMEAATEALLEENLEYEESVEEITNSVIYSSNTDISRKEFRKNINQVLNKEKDWEYFAERSV